MTKKMIENLEENLSNDFLDPSMPIEIIENHLREAGFDLDEVQLDFLQVIQRSLEKC